ncbi:MFS transporter [Nocardia colli]|uniref:MFS transporter n=1 Tax=Nocardia colli TaxID=2545717 RepID=A0A5N0EBW9_9NOCA|nr:MFS transporter [Nocardia colli]KAA8886423.1 MFS transporter [Nocardia colli]
MTSRYEPAPGAFIPRATSSGRESVALPIVVSARRCGRATPPPRAPSAWMLVALCLGGALVTFDNTVVTVGLPQLQERLGITAGLGPWIVDAYVLACTVLLLTGGALADRWGARRMYLNGTWLIAAGSALCAVADSAGLIIAGRVLQGVGAAAVMPGSLSLLKAGYADGRRRARALVIWTTVGSTAAVAGLVVSGVLVSAFGWRSLFWANLALALGTVILSRRCLRETLTVHNSLNLLSQTVFLAALTAFVAGVIQWGAVPDSAAGPVLIAVGVLLAIAFVAVERRYPNPALQLSLLRHPQARATAVVAFVVNFGFYGQLFLLAGFLQRVAGFSPWQTSLVITVEAAGAVLGAPCGSWIAQRSSTNAAMLTGLLVIAGALLFMAAGVWSHALWLVAGTSFLVGLGVDIAITSATAGLLRVAAAGHTGAASALLTMARQLGSVIGVAVLGVAGTAGTSAAGFCRALIIAALGCAGAALLVRRARGARPAPVRQPVHDLRKAQGAK